MAASVASVVRPNPRDELMVLCLKKLSLMRSIEQLNRQRESLIADLVRVQKAEKVLKCALAGQVA